MAELAIIGDVHHQFSEADVDYFNASSYDLILFVGDLSHFYPRKGYRIAQRISRLQIPALFIPGNHDTVNLFQLLAEIKRWPLLTRLLGLGQERRARKLRRSLGKVRFCGYSCHSFFLSGQAFDIIAARPYSMGGPHLNFVSHLRQRYGIATMQASAQRLMGLVERSQSENVIFLAHNGPAGLGSRRTDIWGCDFREDEGDYGDPDLLHAVEFAREKGREVLAVVGGHMHHQLKGGGRRRWCVEQDGTVYINAARVPRIFQQAGSHWRHHVRLSIDAGCVNVEELLVENALVREG